MWVYSSNSSKLKLFYNALSLDKSDYLLSRMTDTYITRVSLFCSINIKRNDINELKSLTQ